MLENINYVISATIMIITSIIFAMILLEKKETKITYKKIIVVLLGIIIYSFGIKYISGIKRTLCLFCLYLTMFKYIFKISYSDAIFLDFLYTVLIMVPDLLILLISIIILKIEPEVFYTTFAGTMISTLMVAIILIVITYIFRKLLIKLMKIKINDNKKIIIYTILTLGCILAIFYSSFENIVLNNNLLISIIIMIVFVVILYSLMKQTMENKKIAEKYDKLLEFIKKYEVIIEEQREARHESKNQLITIKSKVLLKEKDSVIIEYVDSILKEHIGYDEDKYGKFQYLPANGIKGLFYYKSMEAEEKGINLSINIGQRVEDSILSKLSTEDFKQLGRLIGVYLDNAIEASNISEDKKMGIEIYLHNGDVIIIIMNTYAGLIDEESVGTVRYSTKGNNRGHGLMLVNKILNGSDRFKAERTITDKLYIQKLRIRNK